MVHSNKTSLFNSHRRVFLLIVILGACNLASVQGQSVPSPGRWQLLKQDVSDAFYSSTHVLSQPLRWERKDVITFGLISIGTIGLTIFEKDFRRIVLKNKNKNLDKLMKAGETYGDPVAVFLLTGAMYLYGITMKDSWFRETSVIMTSTLFSGGIYQTMAKNLAGRARPYLEIGNRHFEPFRREEDYFSFVSGHTLVAVGTSLVLAKQINQTFATILLYGFGFIGAYSRMYNDYHWFSDVFLGASLAIATSNSSADQRCHKKKDQSMVHWNIYPRGNGIGIAVIW